jgi:methionine aminopeptidase
VVHGVPGDRVARSGELITVDVAAELDGYHADAAVTVAVGHGLVFTIEPMLTAGAARIVLEPDGWTVRTADRAPSAHEEHTIMVSDGGPVVLTAA